MKVFKEKDFGKKTKKHLLWNEWIDRYLMIRAFSKWFTWWISIVSIRQPLKKKRQAHINNKE